MVSKKRNRKMARGKLTAADKASMQSARIESKQQKEAALEALTTNPQFQNPKLWKMVSAELLVAVKKAIQKNEDMAKKAQIVKLEKELEALKNA
jgi:hypothetical protein